MEKIYRSGIGFDVHKLVEGRKCIIGGVDIPYEKGLLGHSDADVLLHAISDALLGAAGLGDIGSFFPDTAPAYKGADSLVLLAEVGKKIKMGQIIKKTAELTADNDGLGCAKAVVFADAVEDKAAKYYKYIVKK